MDMEDESAVPTKKKMAGAIWIHGWRLKRNLERILKEKGITLSEQELNSVFTVGHTLSVKVNYYREKYIAVANNFKSRDTEPDYFLHVYQTHTGSAPIYPRRTGPPSPDGGIQDQVSTGTDGQVDTTWSGTK